MTDGNGGDILIPKVYIGAEVAMNDFLFAQVLTELEDAVGRENCSVREIDKLTHSVDYFWLSRMWADRGRRMPEADFIVSPKDAQETSKVVKIANYYRIPVTAWGGGGGTQGGAIPVCGGILLDTKRMDRIYEINEEGMYIECGAGTATNISNGRRSTIRCCIRTMLRSFPSGRTVSANIGRARRVRAKRCFA